MATTLARPRQVTFAGWMIMVGSAVVVFSAFDRIAGLRSIESQDSVSEFLSKPPGEDLGLSLDQVLDLIQMLTLIAGACATAAGILGFWVLKGSKQARVGLTVPCRPAAHRGVRHWRVRLVPGRRLGVMLAPAGPQLVRRPAAAGPTGAARDCAGGGAARGNTAARADRAGAVADAVRRAGGCPATRPAARGGVGLCADLGLQRLRPRRSRPHRAGAHPLPTCSSTSCTGRTRTSPTRA